MQVLYNSTANALLPTGKGGQPGRGVTGSLLAYGDAVDDVGHYTSPANLSYDLSGVAMGLTQAAATSSGRAQIMAEIKLFELQSSLNGGSLDLSKAPTEVKFAIATAIGSAEYGIASLSGAALAQARAAAQAKGPITGTNEEVPPPKVSTNAMGVTEIKPSGTPTASQERLNVPDANGNGRKNPAEAATAAQLEPAVGSMRPYDGPPTNGTSKPDYVITDGPNAGKTVDMMYTTRNLSTKEVDGLNRNFEQSMTVPKSPEEPPPGVTQIQNHFAKADTVVMDMRTLTPSNQQVLQNYVATLPPAQRSRIVFVTQ